MKTEFEEESTTKKRPQILRQKTTGIASATRYQQLYAIPQVDSKKEFLKMAVELDKKTKNLHLHSDLKRTTNQDNTLILL